MKSGTVKFLHKLGILQALQDLQRKATIMNHFRFRNLGIKFENVNSLRNQTEIFSKQEKEKRK